MKFIALAYVLLFYISFLNGQQAEYNRIAEQFVIDFNAKDYEEIHSSFSENMKEDVSLKKLTGFLNKIHSNYGSILSVELSEFNHGKPAVYKLQFKQDIRSLNFNLNPDLLISGLTIKTYHEPVSVKNDLEVYPTEVANILFKNTKVFANNSQFAVAIIDKDSITYYGVLREDDKLLPIVNHQKVFEIGSITKVFTSTVLARLVTEGKFQLNDPINPYYKFAFKNDSHLDFLSLANHTSGLSKLPSNMGFSNFQNPYKSYGQNKLEDFLKDEMNIQDEKKGQYNYSNIGVGLLGYTLGLSHNASIQELIGEYVLEPYGMNNTYITSGDVKSDLVKGRNQVGEEVPNWDLNVLFAAGGLLSTVEDLSKFAIAHFNEKDKALSFTRKETHKISDEMSIGLGWHILDQEDGSIYYWHNGGTGGYTSSMTFDIKSQKGVVILSNITAYHPNNGFVDDLCFELMNLVSR